MSLFNYLSVSDKDKFCQLQQKVMGFTNTQKLVIAAILSSVAAVMQAAGIIPGVGYLISFMATAPIIIAVFLSSVHGLLAYGLAVILLLIIQPSELIVFPFTTGLLGIGMGFSLCYLGKRIYVILVSGVFLCLGISLILYVFNFPVLGPVAGTNFSIIPFLSIYIFSFFYSWFWLEISRKLLSRLIEILIKIMSH